MRQRFVESAIERRARRRFVSAAAERRRQLRTIERATAAKTRLNASVRLLDRDLRDLDARDLQRHIDNVFAVRRQRSGVVEVLAAQRRNDSLAVEETFATAQRGADQLQPPKRLLLVKNLVNEIDRDARVDQLRDATERRRFRRREPEPTGIGRNRDKNRKRDLRRQRNAERLNRFKNKASGRLGARVDETTVADGVALRVMVDHDLDASGRLEEFAGVAELRPGARVERNAEVGGRDKRPFFVG